MSENKINISISAIDKATPRIGRLLDGMHLRMYGIEHGYPANGAHRMHVDPEGYAAMMHDEVSQWIAEQRA